MKRSTFFTKVVMLLFAGLLTTTTINAQHYSPPGETNGAGRWQLYAGQVTLDGQDMAAGNEIGVFDGSICVGSFVLTQVCTLNNSVGNEFYAWEENGGSTVGYTAENPFTFKLWDIITETEYDDVSITYFDGNYANATLFPAHNNTVWSQIKFAFLTNGGHTVSGTITDDNDDPYEGATVEITNEISIWETTSDGSGDYSLIIPENASTVYTFMVSDAEGYNDYSSAQFAVTAPVTKDHKLVILDGTFTGTVRDQMSNLIEGALVSVNTGTPSTDLTDANGHYSIDVPPGNYTITASKAGYQDDVVVGIPIVSGQLIYEDFDLGALPGAIEGYVKFMDGTTKIGANGVLVSVDGTHLSALTVDEGGNPGYFKIENVTMGYNNITVEGGAFDTKFVEGIQVASGNTTTMDDIILTMNSYYNFTPGDPDEPVWTIYLSEVEDVTNGYELKAGDEIAIYTYHAVPANRTLVGTYQAMGPIDGASPTANPILVFETLADGTTGYTGTDVIEIDIHIAGGTTVTLNNAADESWTADNGGDAFDYDPSANTYFFTTDPLMYSILDIDFEAADGDFVINLEDEDGEPLTATDNITLEIYDGSTTTSITATGATHTFSAVPAQTYTLTISGARFQTLIISGIAIGYAQSIERTYQLDYITSEYQTISLHAGINMISRRVGDVNGVMLDYLDDNFKDNSLDVVSNEGGTPLQKIEGSGWNTPLYAWDIDRGYKFTMRVSDEIYIAGIPIGYNSPIEVAQNFNYVSYYPNYSLDAEAAFATIKHTTDLGYVRQWDGKMLRYLLALTTWDNQIGNTNTGQGYIVYWNNATPEDLIYPAQTGAFKNATEVVNGELEHFDFARGNPFTNICTFYIQSDDLEIGDEVAAFDGDKMVGAVKIVTTDDIIGNALNMFSGLEGDDDGYTPGNPITLVSWKANTNKEFNILYTTLNEHQQNGDEYAYAGDGFPEGDYRYSLVELTMPLSVNENLAEFINVYPNPSTGYVTISSPEQIDRLMLINIVGQTVLDIKPGSGNTELNLDGFNPGVYFVNLIIDGQRITKKLTIQ